MVTRSGIKPDRLPDELLSEGVSSFDAAEAAHRTGLAVRPGARCPEAPRRRGRDLQCCKGLLRDHPAGVPLMGCGAGVVVRRSDDVPPRSQLLRGPAVSGRAQRRGTPTTAGVPGGRGQVPTGSGFRSRADAVRRQQARVAVGDQGGQLPNGHDASVDARGDVARPGQSAPRQRGAQQRRHGVDRAFRGPRDRRAGAGRRGALLPKRVGSGGPGTYSSISPTSISTPSMPSLDPTCTNQPRSTRAVLVAATSTGAGTFG